MYVEDRSRAKKNIFLMSYQVQANNARMKHWMLRSIKQFIKNSSMVW